MVNSIWANRGVLPHFPTLERELKTDVLIIGGGLAGILCAWMLEKDGVDYALIEGDRILGGISRNTTAKITSQHGLIYEKLIREFGTEHARLYWEANEAALKEYRRLAERFDFDLEAKDNYIYSVDSPAKLEKELAALQKLNIPAEFTDRVSLPFPVAGAVKFADQAQFDPLKFGGAIAKGLHIYERTAARVFRENTVLTDRGRILADRIIVATHFPILNKHGSYFLKQYQSRSYVMALENAPDVGGMYLDEAEGGFSFRNSGGKLLLGGGGHRTGKQGSGWKPLEEFTKAYYPGAKEVCRWAAQDCMTLDGVPYIGKYSARTPDLFVATGFNKWGMTASMVSAMILRDLVQGRETIYAQVFSPSRSILRPQLLVNGLGAVGNLLTPTRPRCPHMGCALKWNPWEHSWDCPCHGSRFDGGGTVLDNPATGDMKSGKTTY